MSEMIKRVAKALWDDRHPERSWSDDERRDYEGHARAAMEAMRDPTDEMLGSRYGTEPRRVFTEMIDAALGKVDA
jgi:hypothetical protein